MQSNRLIDCFRSVVHPGAFRVLPVRWARPFPGARSLTRRVPAAYAPHSTTAHVTRSLAVADFIAASHLVGSTSPTGPFVADLPVRYDRLAMKQHNVFYAWQSDHPSRICRSFIRRALEETASQLAQHPAIHNAPRDVTITVDADTKGIPGSPPVADTILAKIANCDAFVADLTPMPTAAGRRASPNPNVLLEYGYALATRGDQRIVAVTNDSFGSPEDLPFDIRHRRWPIRYALASDAPDADRKSARAGLVRALRSALAQVLPAPSIPHDAATRSIDSVESRNLWAVPQYIRREDGGRIEIAHGPSATIELAPAGTTPPRLSNAAMNAAAAGLVLPGAAENESRTGRIHNGVVRCTVDAQTVTIRAASAVTDDSRLHSVDFASPRTESNGNGVVPVAGIESLLTVTLRNLLEVAARHMELAPPLQAWARLTGISDFMLAVDPVMFDRDTVGLILNGQVAREFRIGSFDDDPDTLLRPLFDDLYDAAGGYARPPSA